MKNLISLRKNISLKNSFELIKPSTRKFTEIVENENQKIQQNEKIQKNKNEEFSLNLINKEVNKNFEDLVKKYKIKNASNKKMQKITEKISEKNLSLKEIKQKYLTLEENEENKKYFSLIKKIFKEELTNSKESNIIDELILFVRNCYTYNLTNYLKDPKFFKNKEIRNKVLNTDQLEKEIQAKNPYGYKNELETKIYSGNFYKILKKEKKEKEDFYTKEHIENDTYKYYNFLAENSEYKKLEKFNENIEHNDQLFEKFHKEEELTENPVADLSIDKEISENFYIDFLMKMKEKEREKSEGFSQMDDQIFAKRLAENKDEILSNKDLNENFESIVNKISTDDSEAGREENHFNSFTDNVIEENAATYMQNGIDTPWPYYAQEDYPIDEFFSDSYNKGSTYLVSTLREHGKLPVHPPKIDVSNDKFHADAMKWNFFTMLPNMRINIKNYHQCLSYLHLMNKKTFSDNILKDNSPAHKDPLDTFEHSRQSLIPYYNLLPKWAHENPSVQNIVRSLEFNHNEFSFQEKMVAINIALPLLLPTDDKLAEVAKEIYDVNPEEIKLDNIEELLLHNEDETRKNVILPEDDFTDDKEEFYTFYTAADIRAIEKEEEEERKLKKREEGRAKRAAEEAKAAGESGKKKEEKIDPKDQKKGASEETAEAEPEKQDEQEEEDDEEEVKDNSAGEFTFELNDDVEADEDMIFKTKKPKAEKKKVEKEENKYITERKEALRLIEIKKDQDKLFSEYLKKNSSIKLDTNYINISREMIDVKTGKIDLSNYNMQEIPLAMIMTNKFVNEYDLTKLQRTEFLDIIKKNPNIDIRVSMSEKGREEYVIIENDPKQKKNKNTEQEVNVEDDDIDEINDLYKSSLKETEIKIETEDDLTLKDIYYKPLTDLDYYEKSYHLPLDYYDNNDGFYDEWLNHQKEKIDISQYNMKPFISKRKRIKHISEIQI